MGLTVYGLSFTDCEAINEMKENSCLILPYVPANIGLARDIGEGSGGQVYTTCLLVSSSSWKACRRLRIPFHGSFSACESGPENENRGQGLTTILPFPCLWAKERRRGRRESYAWNRLHDSLSTYKTPPPTSWITRRCWWIPCPMPSDSFSNSGNRMARERILQLQEEIQAVTPVVPPLVSHLVTGELQVLTD